MTTAAITMTTAAMPAISRVLGPLLVSAAGLVVGEGAAEVGGGLVGAALVGFFHHMKQGPLEVPEDDEDYVPDGEPNVIQLDGSRVPEHGATHEGEAR